MAQWCHIKRNCNLSPAISNNPTCKFWDFIPEHDSLSSRTFSCSSIDFSSESFKSHQVSQSVLHNQKRNLQSECEETASGGKFPSGKKPWAGRDLSALTGNGEKEIENNGVIAMETEWRFIVCLFFSCIYKINWRFIKQKRVHWWWTIVKMLLVVTVLGRLNDYCTTTLLQAAKPLFFCPTATALCGALRCR